MTNDRPDRADTITIPPLIYLAFFVAGVALDYVWPIAVLPQRLQYVVGFAIVALSGVIIAWTLPIKRTDLEPSSGSGITFMWYFVSSTMVCNVYDYF